MERTAANGKVRSENFFYIKSRQYVVKLGVTEQNGHYKNKRQNLNIYHQTAEECFPLQWSVLCFNKQRWLVDSLVHTVYYSGIHACY